MKKLSSILLIALLIGLCLVPGASAAAPGKNTQPVSGTLAETLILQAAPSEIAEPTPQEPEMSDADMIADKEDGINLRAATVWIIVSGAVLILAIGGLVFHLAVKNGKKQK